MNKLILDEILLWIFIPSTLIFLIMTLGSLIGFGDTDIDIDTDVDLDIESDVDVSSDGLPIFTIKNALAFLAMFSATSIMFLKYNFSQLESLGLGVLCGLVFTGILITLFVSINKLKQINISSLSSVIGEEGTVYLRVPGDNSGTGQVNVNLHGNGMQIMPAITNYPEDIMRGSTIEVVGVSGTTLIVSPVPSTFI